MKRICDFCGSEVKIKREKNVLKKVCDRCGLQYTFDKVVRRATDLKGIDVHSLINFSELLRIINENTPISANWLYKLCLRGDIPCLKIGGRLFFKKDEIEDIKKYLELLKRKE